jgi:hypothetical protein
VSITAAEFKKKWARARAKETASYQEHFVDLCRLLGQPTPNEADPSGSDFFCFQKRVIKDLELFELHETPLTDEQILERLLALNLERAAEEEKTASLKKPKSSRAKREDELI